MRGKPSRLHLRLHLGRLIPACAGKTLDEDSPIVELLGSSPRVRGKPRRHPPNPPPARLIPACAGKTWAWGAPSGCGWAHPRVCGENDDQGPGVVLVEGSSPRVRGKPGWGVRSGAYSGLIPACAGKTIPRTSATRSSGAHPRVCGENPRRGPAAPTTPGSSPRVRGKLPLDADKRHSLRLIPACAGKTRTAPSGRASPTAHPRVCGENDRWDSSVCATAGSSPRVRGKHRLLRRRDRPLRLIPACAGKTIPWRAMRDGDRAHPRVCGENSASPRIASRSRGSSPRVRGK